MILPDALQIADYRAEKIQSEISSETELILQRIRLYARRRVIWLQHLWSTENSQGSQAVITHSAVESYLSNRDNRTDEAQFFRQNPEVHELNGAIQSVEDEFRLHGAMRINRLVTLFQLSEFEADLVQTCFAGAVDSQFNKIFAYLHDHSGQPFVTLYLVQRLFGYSPGTAQAVLDKSLTWRILHKVNNNPGEPAIYVLDDEIFRWLLGSENISPAVNQVVIPVEKHIPLESWPITRAADALRKCAENHHHRLIIAGAPGSGRKTLARYAAERTGQDILFIDVSGMNELNAETILRIRRTAFLHDKLVAWYRSDAFARNLTNRSVQPCGEIFIEERHYPSKSVRGIDETIIRMPDLSISERKQLWQQMIPESRLWDREEFQSFTAQFRITVGDIRQIADADVRSFDQLYTHMKNVSHPALDSLAERLDSEFTMDDLVLPDHTSQILSDMYFEARARGLFWEDRKNRRLFPQGRGLLTLFTGPPGTGKTMAAQVLANRLRLQLYRIDLSTVVSKYVGETSKNLEKVIREAQGLNVILFFDEADALFGKRTEISDAHDRFANTDTGYLLQAIEEYDGVAILASNKKGNLDPAFIRRLRYAVEFPKPDATLRQTIWNKLLPELLPAENRDDLAPVVSRISTHLTLTGAQIKYAILSAIFLAKQERVSVSATHLITGIERELMKEGQGLTTKQKELMTGP